MRIRTIEVNGLFPAMIAIHLPVGNEPKCSRKALGDDGMVRKDNGEYISCTQFLEFIPESDIELASRLVQAGDEQAKVMRGVVVYVEITAPIYLWNEFVTYRVGAECLSSTSTMHIECKGLNGEALQKAKAEIPMGHEQTRVLMISYQTLRRIYFQRRNHRLPEWHTVCDWIKGLPFADKLITVERAKK